MVKLAWLDFTKHNETTGENLRAFSVNHPIAGRLVVIKGISDTYTNGMTSIGFTSTKDGSWVIKASKLNVHALQTTVVPMLGMKEVNLSDIDLTDQFVKQSAAVQPGAESSTVELESETINRPHPGLNWISKSSRDSEEGTHTIFEGILPSSVAHSLWAALDESAEKENLLNGQTVYRGEIESRFFVLVKRQQLFGSAQRIQYFEAETPALLPNHAARLQAPAIFQISDAVKGQLDEIGSYYGFNTGTLHNEAFTPSRRLNLTFAQQSLNLSDAPTGAINQVKISAQRPFVMASSEYNPGVTVQEIEEAFGNDSLQQIVETLSESDWISQGEVINSVALMNNSAFTRTVLSRGADAIVFYTDIGNAITGRDSFISSNNMALYIKPLSSSIVEVIGTETIHNMSKIPNGFKINEGDGNRAGQISLEHIETGELVRKDNESWFANIVDAVQAIELPENTFFVNPSIEEIDNILDEVFADPIDVIAYRGEHGEVVEGVPFQTRLGSISFSNEGAASVYALSPNDNESEVIAPRVIEARLTISKPLINDLEDPFIDFTTLISAVGHDKALEIAHSLSYYIEQTNNFSEIVKEADLDIRSVAGLLRTNPELLSQLYVDAYLVLDNPEWVSWFADAGFDGAVHGGNGETALEAEYKIFDPAQAEILNIRAIEVEPVEAEVPTDEAEEEVELTTTEISDDILSTVPLETNTITSPVVNREQIEQALDELASSKFFKDANIEVVREQSEWVIVHRGTPLSRFAGELNRRNVEDALIRDLELEEFTNEKFYSRIDSSDNKLEMFKDILDPAFEQRYAEVRTLLLDLKYSRSDRGHVLFSPSNDSTVRAEFKLTQDDEKIVGVTYHVGDQSIRDNFKQSPLQMAGAIHDLVIQAELKEEMPVENTRVAISELTSQEALEAALSADREIIDNDSVFSVVKSTSGWIVLENRGGVSITKGGDPRGGGYSKTEAIKRLQSELDHHFDAPVIEQSAIASEIDAPTSTVPLGPIVGSDLFSSDPLPLGKPVELRRAPSHKQFLVCGDGLVMVDKQLEDAGGKFIKKHGGFRFDKSSELGIRTLLRKAEADGLISVNDQIRIPFNLKLNAKLSDPAGRPYKVTEIVRREDGDLNVVLLLDQNNSYMIALTHTTAKGMEGDLDVTISNWDYLNAEYPLLNKSVESIVETDANANPSVISDVDEEQEEINAPALSVITGESPSLPIEEAEEKFPEFTVFRGTTVERLGKNNQNEFIYGNDDGLRFIKSEDGIVYAESPFVTEAGDFAAPADRLLRFKLLSELQAEAQVSENVIALRTAQAPAAEDKTDLLTNEEFDAAFQHTGITSTALDEYFRAYSKLRAAQEDKEGDESNSFTERRLEIELGKKATHIQNIALSRGYNVAIPLLEKMAEDQFQKFSHTVSKIANTIYSQGIARAIEEKKHVFLEDALTLDINVAHGLPPYWVNEKLTKCMQREDYSAYAVFISKVYGSTEELQEAITTVQTGDIDVIKALAEELKAKYEKTRALVELPSMIKDTHDRFNDYKGASPIPRRNLENLLSEHYRNLAKVQFDTDAIEITEEDIEIFRNTGSYSESVEQLALKHGLSYDAGRLYCERVEKLIETRLLNQFANSPETLVIQEAAKIVQQQVPEGLIVSFGNHPDTANIKFRFGAGVITASRPDQLNRGTNTYSVYYSYSNSDMGMSEYDRTTGYDYEGLPTAEVIAKDALSFAQLSHSQTKIYHSPAYGEKYEALDSNSRHNLTAIAKLVREDIKNAINLGHLPKGLKVSVRKDYNSIGITITKVPDGFQIVNPRYAQHRENNPGWTPPPHRIDRHSHEANALHNALKNYLNAYNYDNSDLQTDYYNTNYYSSVRFESELEEESLKKATENLIDPESENAIYRLVNNSAFRHIEEFTSTGFTYIGNRRVGLQFNHDGQLILENNLVTARETVIDQNGLTVGASKGASEILRLAYAGISEAYQLENRDFFSEVTAEQSRDQDVLDNDLTELPEATPETPAIESSAQDQAINLDNSDVEEYVAPSIVVLENRDNAVFSEQLEAAIKHMEELGAVPTPYSSPIESHFNRAYVARAHNGLYEMLLTAGFPAGDANGVLIQVSNVPTAQDVVVETANAFERYAKGAFANMQANGMADSLVILNALEKYVGRHRFTSNLITDPERKIASTGLVAINDYYQGMSDRFANTLEPGLLVKQTVTIPAIEGFCSAGTFSLAQLDNSQFVWGANIVLANGNSIVTHVKGSNTPFELPQDAAASFIKTLSSLGVNPEAIEAELYNTFAEVVPVNRMEANYPIPDLTASEAYSILAKQSKMQSKFAERLASASTDEERETINNEQREFEINLKEALVVHVLKLIQNNGLETLNLNEEYVENLAAEYPELRRAWNRYELSGSPFSRETDEAMLRIWLKDAGLAETHKIDGNSLVPIDMDGSIKSLGVSENINTDTLATTYSIEMDTIETASKATLINQARIAGAIVDDETVHFSNKENLDQFASENELQLTVINSSESESSNLNTTARHGNISLALKNELDKAGYLQTQESNVWATATENDGALKISFYEGIGRNTIEVKLQYSKYGRKENDHIVDLSADIGIDDLETAINEHLAALNVDPIRKPAFTPALPDISGEMICQVLLGAGLNIEETSKKTWVVSGDTYGYRNQLDILGGDYSHPDGKKPLWEYKEPPAAKLAVLIASRVELAKPQTEIDGFFATVSYNAKGHNFETLLNKGDPKQQIIIGTHSSLSKARVSILNAITDSAKLSQLWNKVYPLSAQTNGSQKTEETFENEHAEPTHSPGESTSRQNAAGVSSQQRPMAAKPDAGNTQAVAGASRGNDEQPRGPDNGEGRKDSSGQSAEPRGSSTDTNDDPQRTTSNDGRVLRKPDDRELFNLNEVRNSQNNQTENLAQNTLNAIRTLIVLRNEKREATPEEKITLSKMVGLGAGQFTTGSTAIFGGYSHNDLNSAIRKAIDGNFSNEERNSLRNTVLTAFYTPDTITSFMWGALERFGLNSLDRPLDIVDPGVGTGNFIGTAPIATRQNANFHGIECDSITAEIASRLYPEVKIINKEFQNVQYTANSKDLFIGNPPYSDVRTFNPSTGKREVLHDLFLRESINAVRPGGFVSFVTSSGTLDKKGATLRLDISTKADLVAAFRLPNSAFKKDAGTEVMTDILFFRKRKEGEQALNNNWVNTVVFSEGEDGNNDVLVNQYYLDNPSHVLGTLRTASGKFGRVLSCMDDGAELGEQLREALRLLPDIQFNPDIKRKIAVIAKENEKEVAETLGSEIPAGAQLGELIIGTADDIRIIRYNGSNAEYYSEPAPVKAANAQLIKDYIKLRDTARELISLERHYESEEINQRLEEKRVSLNGLYDHFAGQYGPISRKATSRILRQDPGYYFTAQLEHYDKDTDTAIKADVLSRRVLKAEQLPVISSPLDAALYSISNLGHIEPSMMEDLLGRDWEAIRSELGESVYLDPKSGKYYTASIYLSGDVIEKMEAAERALITNPEMEMNIAALKEAIPTPISITEIRIKIGATWIPETILTQFVQNILKASDYSRREKCYVNFNDTLKVWNFKVTDMVLRDAKTRNEIEYGTPDFPFHKLFKHCLEQTRPTVHIELDDGTRQIHPERTQAARDKQDLIEEQFVSMILNDTKLAIQAQKAYNYRMNRYVPIKADGKYLSFPGLAAELKGKPFVHGVHQLGVIERAITSDVGTLIAHEAGAGKTISTTSICIKAKQLGIAKKPLIAVPNHMLIQYTTEALDLFPNARILTISKEDLDKTSREQFAYKCLMNDWDLVICTHEQFTKMKMPEWYVRNSIENEISDLEEMIFQSNGDRATIKQLERQKKSLNERLTAEMAKLSENQDDIDFTSLGFDWVAYDEAHYLKNRAFPTKNSNLAGVQSITSQRARDAEMKFDFVRQYRGDSKGVLLATGTPLSNTIGEIMVILRYTAPELLERSGIYNFDDFIANYGQTKIHVELTADGSGYQLKERLSDFHNIPELMKLFVQVADIKMGDQLDLKRPDENRITRVSEMSPEQRMFMDWLTHRARAVKQGNVEPQVDNMLKIYSDLQTISIDPRLYHHKLTDHADSKINQEVESIYEQWVNGAENLDTQLIFVDRFQKTEKTKTGVTPKGKPKYTSTVVFNLIDDIKEKLIKKGIPAEDIGSIHDTKSDEEKEEFFTQIRKGKIRIVFASTAKMGVGTNVQTRGKDLRHLSYPMRAIDIEQRNKRFVRQGNMNTVVNLHYPTTKDSGDLALLQMIERKDKMTKQIMSCDFENMARSFEEDFTPSYEDIMAVTTGNTLIKEKLETDSLVDKYRRQRKAHSNQCYTAKLNHIGLVESRIPDMKSYINQSKILAEKIPLDSIDSFKMNIKGVEYTKPLVAGGALSVLASKIVGLSVKQEVGKYLGYPLSVGRDKFGQHYLQMKVGGIEFKTDITENLSYFPSRIGSLIKSRITGIDQGIEKLGMLEQEAKDLLELSAKPYPYDAELAAAEERLSQLNVELAKEEKNNSVVKLDGPHPFELLLAKLNGEEITNANTKMNGLLSDEEIMNALDAEIVDESERNSIKELTLTR